MTEADYVFDTEPLIAYLYGERGADQVADVLHEVDAGSSSAAISHATAVELVYKVARLETGDLDNSPPENALEAGERDLRVLRGFGVDLLTPSWNQVAEIKAAGGISLGDSYAAALAAESDATLVVGDDPEFDDLNLDLEIERVTEQE